MDEDEVGRFLGAQTVGRVGCHAGGTTYVVPVIYAWEAGYAYVFSVEGQKIRMMRENPRVCFEVDEQLAGGGWRSVIIQGTFEELEGEGAARTRDLLVERFAGRSAGERRRPADTGVVPVAFRIRADEATGRKVERST